MKTRGKENRLPVSHQGPKLKAHDLVQVQRHPNGGKHRRHQQCGTVITVGGISPGREGAYIHFGDGDAWVSFPYLSLRQGPQHTDDCTCHTCDAADGPGPIRPIGLFDPDDDERAGGDPDSAPPSNEMCHRALKRRPILWLACEGDEVRHAYFREYKGPKGERVCGLSTVFDLGWWQNHMGDKQPHLRCTDCLKALVRAILETEL